MNDPSSNEIQRAFAAYCIKSLRRECYLYYREEARRIRRESRFSEMEDYEMDQLSTNDDYDLESETFRVLDYDVKVRDELIAEALKGLTKRKREVILLSFFLGMSDTEIGSELHLGNSTVHEHRIKSLGMLKKYLERKLDHDKKTK